MAAAGKPLTPQQLKFVGLYVGGLSAAAAYVKAGYKARGNAAESAASRLLRNVQVCSAVDAARQKGADKAAVTAEYVITGLKREANLKKNSGAARVRAFELLGKTINLFPNTTTTRVEGGDPAKPVQHDVTGTITASPDLFDRIAALTTSFAGRALGAGGGDHSGDGI